MLCVDYGISFIELSEAKTFRMLSDMMYKSGHILFRLIICKIF
jgi:hypothetical protein